MLALAALGPPPTAQDWPTRAVTMVVPFGAGSASDTAGRIIGARMSELLGQQVVVENTPGAGGMTGSARVVNAAPDGYTASFASTDTIAINQTLYKRPLYNAATDFAPVALVVEQPMVLIVRADLPVTTLQEFIAYAKANQAKHAVRLVRRRLVLASRLHARERRASASRPAHVPYRGSGQAMQDLVGGRIDYFCALGAAAMVPLENKTAKAIAVLARERSPLFPAVAEPAGAGPARTSRPISGAASSIRRTPPADRAEAARGDIAGARHAGDGGAAEQGRHNRRAEGRRRPARSEEVRRRRDRGLGQDHQGEQHQLGLRPTGSLRRHSGAARTSAVNARRTCEQATTDASDLAIPSARMRAYRATAPRNNSGDVAAPRTASSLRLQSRRAHDRPPFVDLGLVVGGERLRRLLLAPETSWPTSDSRLLDGRIGERAHRPRR